MPSTMGIAADVVEETASNGSNVQFFRLLTKEKGVPKRYNVAAFNTVRVGHGNVVKVLHNGITEEAWSSNGKSGVNLRIKTNGDGLIIVNGRNVLDDERPKAAAQPHEGAR